MPDIPRSFFYMVYTFYATVIPTRSNIFLLISARYFLGMRPGIQ